jgi:protein involved in ribonucleotide reduction
MELDANGNKLWQKTYGGSGSDYANSIIRTPDGGYMVQASSWSEDGDITRHVSTMQYDYDWWIFKIDASGNKVWDRNFGGSALDIASNIIAVNGGYLITGATKSSDYDAVGSHGDDDGLVIKIDESGNEIWSHVYGGAASDGFFAVIPTQDGGFLFTGNASSTDGDVSENKGAADAWVVKTDENGAIVWQKTFGGSGQEDARFVIPTSNGGYLIAGSTQSSSGDVTSNQGSYDGWVLTLDASGNKVWQKSYGGSTNEWFTLICKGADGFYVGVGSTDSNNGDCIGSHGSTEAWAVKFNIQ